MSGDSWQEVCRESDLEEGIPYPVRAGKRTILLVKRGDRIHGVGSRCPHYGAPLAEGAVFGHVMTCSRHTARFDLASGRMDAPPALEDISHYLVKCEGGSVLVKPGPSSVEPVEVREGRGTLVIVGGGGAGCAAAITLRREGFDGRVVLASAEMDLPYDRTNLSKGYLTGEVDPDWVSLKNDDFYRLMGIEVFSGYQLYSLDPKNRELLFTNSVNLSYDKLLIATGGVPRTPDIPGVFMRNFFLLRSFENARMIKRTMEGAKRAVVIGAGFIGLEVAASLVTAGLEVHVVAPEETLLEETFGERIGALLRNQHEERGVHFHLGLFPEEVRGDRAVREVLLSDGSRIPADMVIAGMGIVPAVHFVMDTGIVEDNLITVDGNFRTAAQDVYAAGDVALVPDFITGGKRHVEHWVEAQRQGMHAARSMLGFSDTYREVPFFWTEQFGLTLKYAGHTGPRPSVVFRGDVEQKSFLAGYYRKRKLEAVAGMGRDEELLVLSELLRRGVSVSQGEFAQDGVDVRKYLE